jgi:hypothetical protein
MFHTYHHKSLVTHTYIACSRSLSSSCTLRCTRDMLSAPMEVVVPHLPVRRQTGSLGRQDDAPMNRGLGVSVAKTANGAERKAQHKQTANREEETTEAEAEAVVRYGQATDEREHLPAPASVRARGSPCADHHCRARPRCGGRLQGRLLGPRDSPPAQCAPLPPSSATNSCPLKLEGRPT